MSTSVREVGVDWITATDRTPSKDSPLQLLGRANCELEQAAGFDLKLWTWRGYSGASCGRASYGWRHDGSILRLSGNLAANRWRAIVLASSRVSRLDLAVTIYDDEPSAARGRTAYAHLVEATTNGDEHKQMSLVVSYPAGETLYLGRRSSERYARLYDKHAESGDPAYLGCWRYETELKGDVADRVARRLAVVPSTSMAILAFVHDHFTSRGVEAPWTPKGPIINGIVPRTRSDDERRLAWLRLQVAPSVRHLIAHGLEGSVRTALGLGCPSHSGASSGANSA